MKYYIDHKDLASPLEIQRPFRFEDLADDRQELKCEFITEGRKLISSLYNQFGPDVEIFLSIENKIKLPLMVYTMEITQDRLVCFASKTNFQTN